MVGHPVIMVAIIGKDIAQLKIHTIAHPQTQLGDTLADDLGPANENGPGEPFVNGLLDGAQDPAIFALGLSGSKFGAVTLPLALGGGCQLSQDLIVMAVLNTGLNGNITQTAPIPTDIKIRGAKLYMQFAIDDALLMSKLKIHSTADLVRFAIREGLVAP